MRLTRLITKNFKKLGTVDIEFTAGLNVIAGDNAQGKSTTLQAIEAALFGVTVVPGKKENIPTWGQKDFGLEMHFIIASDFYVVTRNKSTAKLIRRSGTDELVANGNTPVTAAVEELLGLSARDYNLFVQSKQGDASGILTFGATALNKKVEEFAGVDLIDAIQTKAQKAATLYNSYAEAKQVSPEDIEASAAARDQAVHQLETAVGERDQAHEAQLSQPAKPDAPAVSAAALRQQAKEAAKLEALMTAADQAKASAEKALAAAEERAAALSAIDTEALQAAITTLRSDGKTLATTHTSLVDRAADYSRAEKKLAKAQAAVPADFDLEAKQQELQLAQETLDSDQESLARETEEVGKARAKYENLNSMAEGAVCPTCGHAKEDHDPAKLAEEAAEAKKWLDNRTAVVSKLKEDIATMRNVSYNLAESISDYHKAVKAVKDAQVELDGMEKVEQSAIDAAQLELDTARNEYAKKKAELDGAEEHNDRYRHEWRMLEKAAQELEVCQDTCETYDQQWADLPEPPTDHEVEVAEQAEHVYQQALSAWTLQASQLKQAAEYADREVNLLSSAQDTAIQAHQQLLDKNVAAANDLALSKRYDRLVRFLRDRRQDYLKEVWTTVMAVSSRLVSSASSGTITRVDNIDGDFYFEEEGVMAPTTSASGAQKGFIGTALRIGLARALYGSDSLLIFDEPTESCSERNASAMSAMLATSARQVLLITHRETDQALAENLINIGE